LTNPPKGVAYRVAESVLRPMFVALTKRDWRGTENVPTEGGAVIVANHLSYVDPIVVGHFLNDQGRAPRFLAKNSLFTIPLLGPFLRSAGQIPVHRERRSAGDALAEACEAIGRGESVLVYPEGTITRDPDLWPMVGKSGAVRIALRTGAPVIPIGHWGAQFLLKPYGKLPRLLPRKTMRVAAGPPLDLSAFRGLELTPALARKATVAVMAAVTGLVAGLRGEQPPAEPFDPTKSGLPTTGNPYKKKRRAK
jgi:1-acyl-sn-glycerol-3-phosphate acyltransferase